MRRVICEKYPLTFAVNLNFYKIIVFFKKSLGIASME